MGTTMYEGTPRVVTGRTLDTRRDRGSLLALARRAWLILLLGAGIGGWAAYLFASQEARTYESEVSLLTGPINADFDTQRAAGNLTRTYADLASSGPVLSDAAGAAQVDAPLKDLQRDVAASSNDVTRIVTVRVTRHDAGEATRLATAIGDTLIALGAPSGRTPIDIFMDQNVVAGLSPAKQAAIRVAAANAFGDFTAGRLRVVDPARPPTAAAGPQITLITVLGVLAGLVLAGLIVFVREATSNAIESEDDLAHAAGLPLLGSLRTGGRLGRRARVVEPSERSRAADEFNIVAAKLGVGGDGDARSVLVVSADPRARSGAVATSLAAVLTERDLRVALVDADDAEQDVTRLLRLDDRPGYSELLEDALDNGPADARLADVGVPRWPNLAVIPHGSGEPRPLDRVRARQILDRLLTDADVVVVSASPVGHGSATLTWGAVTDVTLLLAERRTSWESVERALGELERAGANVLGTAFVRRRGRWGRRGTGSTRRPGSSTPTGALQRGEVREGGS
jgi:succinoglycan biosynthesis transport protein ExoP